MMRHICTIFIHVSGMCSVISGYGHLRVSGPAGGEAVVRCRFGPEYGPKPKYLQRDLGSGRAQELVRSAGAEGCVSLKRYSLCDQRDRRSAAAVTATVRNLTLGDAGWYRCAVRTGWIQDPYQLIWLDVHQSPASSAASSLSSSSPSSTSSPGPKTSSHTSAQISHTTASSPPPSSSPSPGPDEGSGRDGTHSHEPALRGVEAGALVVASTCLLFICWKHSKAPAAGALATSSTTTNLTTRPPGSDSGIYENARHTSNHDNMLLRPSVCPLATARPGHSVADTDYINGSLPPHGSPVPTESVYQPLHLPLPSSPTDTQPDYLTLQPNTGVSSPVYLSLDSPSSPSESIYDSLQ